MAASVGRVMPISMDMQAFNDVLRSLEEGSTLTAFFKTKKPEMSLFRVKLETRELVGARVKGGCKKSVGPQTTIVSTILGIIAFCAHLLREVVCGIVRDMGGCY